MSSPLILVADMGATFSRVGIIDEFNALRHIETLASTDFASPKEVIEKYLQDHSLEEPDHIYIAVAAPLISDRLILTNIDWDFTIQEVAHGLNTKVTFVNDFEALSLSIHQLPLHDIEALDNVPENIDAPKVVIGTGTGFGTALVIKSGEETMSLPSEGGHALYSPQDKEELELLKLAMTETARPLIVEDFLSCKQGIPRLIRLMAQLHQKHTAFHNAEGLVHYALKEQDPFAQQILHRYCSMLGNTASNIALNTGAQGGIYLGGGFVPRFTDFLKQSNFRKAFENKATVEGYLQAIPCYVITHPYATLIGLQHLLTQS